MYCLSLLTFIKKNMKISKLFFTILLFTSLITLSSCGMYKKVDQRQMPDGAEAKARKNIDEGKGMSIGGLIVNVVEVQLMNLVLQIQCGELH